MGSKGAILRPLGSITKSHAIPENKGVQENGSSFLLHRVKQVKFCNQANLSNISQRIIRYSLQQKSSDILIDERVKRGGRYVQKHRVVYCLKLKRCAATDVSVMYNKDRKKANFGNLFRCSSVWNCPVCASQISETRRSELQLALKRWREKGGFCYLVTFTNRHFFGMCLKTLLDGQKKAFVKLWQKRIITESMSRLGYVGRVVATEVTYSDNNGWHPHYHAIFFFDKKVDERHLAELFAEHWQDVCVKVGLPAPTLEHGVDVRGGDYASQYVGKWGLDYELTKGHVKKGKEGGLTPFDLLRLTDTKDKYAELFKQFSNVFKGKRQLFWTKGLKQLLEIETKTDDEIVEETEKVSFEVMKIADVLWSVICNNNYRAKVLDLAEYDVENETTHLNNFIIEILDKEIQEQRF